MKSLLVFLLGAVVGAFAYSLYIARKPEPLPPPPPAALRTLGERAADTTTELKDHLAAKAKEWHLTPEELKQDLQKGGKIVREKASTAGGKITDARIITVIKSKYILDRDLSAMDIKVDCTNGHVTLTGSLASFDLVTKAFFHAMDTDGVVSVTSNLTTP